MAEEKKAFHDQDYDGLQLDIDTILMEIRADSRCIKPTDSSYVAPNKHKDLEHVYDILGDNIVNKLNTQIFQNQ